MKTLTKFLLAALSLAGQFSYAQTVTVPPKNPPPNYITPNATAASFVDSRGIVDPVEIRYFHQWYNGLASLGITDSDILYMASLRSQHNPVTGSTFFPMKGPTTVTVGSPTFTTNGCQFDGTGTKYVRINNTFGASLANYTIVCAFKANLTGVFGAVVGGYDGTTATAKGPHVMAHGSPSAGYTPYFVYNYWSGNGTTNGTATQSGIASSRCASGGPEFYIHTFAANNVTAKINLDVMRSTAVTGYGPSANNATYWTIGRLVDTTSAALNGEVAFFMLLNKTIPETTQNELRKLYTRTLGMTYIPRVNLLIDGDSLTIGTGTEIVYGQHFGTNAIWGQYTVHRNVAVSGSTVAGTGSRWTNDLSRFQIDNDYAIRQYYMDFVGNNDMTSGSPTTSVDLVNARKILWANARAAGMKVVVFTTAFSTNIAANVNYRTHWTNANNLVKAAFPYYDYLIRIDEDPRMLNFWDTTYYQADGVHFTSAGQKVIEGLITTTIPYP